MHHPAQELSVNEQMVGTRCRLGFIQYMPKKPTKFGIKIWTLAEAQSGYCPSFQIYTGKTENAQEKGLSYRVVSDLVSKYLNKNHHVYQDNYFTSIPLLKDIAEKGTCCCGTIRSDRGKFPDDFKKAKLERGQSIFLSDDNLLAVHWKDERDVFVLST